MHNKKRLFLIPLVFILTFIFSVPTHAATYKTIRYEEAKYGSYYISRPYNTEFHIRKAGSGKIKKLRMPSVYSIAGVTNGSKIYFTALKSKFSV